MSQEHIQTLLVAIASIFAGGGFWAWLSSKHRPEIDRETAIAASTKDAGELALTIAERADARSERSEARITALEARLQAWIGWGTRLVGSWDYYRRFETPPKLPE